MDNTRIGEIQRETAYPDSTSVQQALLKVWNETVQDSKSDFESLVSEKFAEAKEGELFMKYKGELTNIRDLPKERYEQFLETMRGLQAFYIALVERG